MVPDISGERSIASKEGFEEATQLARESGDDWVLATILCLHGTFCLRRGQVARGEDCYSESYAIFSRRGDIRSAAVALRGLANVAHHQGDRRRARLLADRGLEYAEHLGDPVGANAAEILLGELDRDAGELERARRGNERILARARRMGHVRLLIASSLNLGFICLELGDVDAACEYLLGAGERAEKAADVAFLAVIVAGLGCVAIASENTALAADLFGSAIKSAEDSGLVFEPSDAAVIARWQARLPAQATESALHASALPTVEALSSARRFFDLELGIGSASA
jgi:hypothetical protein